jgi:hypothetical protein
MGKGGSNGEDRKRKDEEEVTSPLKCKDSVSVDGKSKKVLFLEDGVTNEAQQGARVEEKIKESADDLLVKESSGKKGNVHSAMQVDHVEKESVKESEKVGKGKMGKGGVLGKLVFGSITLVRPRQPLLVCVRSRSRGEAFAVRALTKR